MGYVPQAMSRKRGRDSDLLEPLQSDSDRENLPSSLEFHEILDPEVSPPPLHAHHLPLKRRSTYLLGFDTRIMHHQPCTRKNSLGIYRRS
jgi:hypothetical protein